MWRWHAMEETEHKEVKHIGQLSRIDEQQYVWLDKFTIRNLELIHPSQSDGTALIDIMDSTQTPMGSRLLRKWMVLPLKNKEQIERRLNTVEAFMEEDDLLNEVRAGGLFALAHRGKSCPSLNCAVAGSQCS